MGKERPPKYVIRTKDDIYIGYHNKKDLPYGIRAAKQQTGRRPAVYVRTKYKIVTKSSKKSTKKSSSTRKGSRRSRGGRRRR